MISFEFEYYKPETVTEAIQTFTRLSAEGKDPLYYGGGTEIISMARANNIYTKAVVDIKGIPECTNLVFSGDDLIIGAAVTLTQIAESGYFPLLGSTGSRIADHTIQGKVTLAGNIASTIIYRETVLPLLLSDCQLTVAGINSTRRVSIHDVFHERLTINPGEFITQITIDRSFAASPYYHKKRVKMEKIDYPLLTIAALKKNHEIRLAMSGVCNYPFRSLIIEKDLNQKSLPPKERINQALSHLPAPILSDIVASGEYRQFVLKNTLHEALTSLEGLA